jgi:hypothetical protein
VPEWLKGTDCKSVGYAYVGSNPTPSTNLRGPCRFDWHASLNAAKIATPKLQSSEGGQPERDLPLKLTAQAENAGVAQW